MRSSAETTDCATHPRASNDSTTGRPARFEITSATVDSLSWSCLTPRGSHRSANGRVLTGTCSSTFGRHPARATWSFRRESSRTRMARFESWSTPYTFRRFRYPREGTMTPFTAIATIMIVGSCGTPLRPVAGQAPKGSTSSHSSTARFAETLQRGGSLFGVGVGCDEWRAEPSRDPAEPGGDLVAQTAHEGRMYAFSYNLMQEEHVLRLVTAGRGSWSPAPDATFPIDENGYGLVGTASYCIVEHDVRASPVTLDAVLVGDETWFMTKRACLTHRRSPDILHCSAKGKRAPRAE